MNLKNVFSNPIANLDKTEPIEIDNKQNEVKYGDIFFTTSSETPEEVGMSSVWFENKANVYLKELADKKTLECEIVAYTYQNHATAICFLDGMSINQNLVDAGFATDVAL